MASPATEAAGKADFSRLRYAQCWEDADALVAGLAIEPGDTCVSIASGGDNALALLTGDPARVIAIDLNPAQLAACRLRLAAYRRLEHGELLELIGSRPAGARRRLALFGRCAADLERDEQGRAARRYWQAHPRLLAGGIGDAGKFESYFRLFRRKALPLVHRGRAVAALLRGGPPARRRAFHDRVWDSWRWRALFRVFFSRRLMGALGRDPAFFDYVEGSVADRIRQRVTHALTELDPAANPYLHWILRGRHGAALPLALREEHFAAIRDRVDRVELRLATVEQLLDDLPDGAVQRWNLSDIFEYMSPTATETLLARIARGTSSGGRLLYWNMLAPRSRPDSLADRLRPLPELRQRLHLADKAFFYSRLVVEERA